MGHMAKNTDLAREETRAKLALGQKTVLNVAEEGKVKNQNHCRASAGSL